MFAPARVPPSLASPHPSGTHAPSHVVGRQAPARGRSTRAQRRRVSSGSWHQFPRGGAIERFLRARVGRKGNPTAQGQKDPIGQGISPFPAPLPERQEAPRCPTPTPAHVVSGYASRRACDAGPPTICESAAPRTHDRRRVAASSFQRHIGCGRGVTSPIQAGSTPLHWSAAR
jgi:hypothetical protein